MSVQQEKLEPGIPALREAEARGPQVWAQLGKLET